MPNGHHDPDDPENNISRLLPYVFPTGTCVELLEQHGFTHVDLQPEGEQLYTYNLQMTVAVAGLTVPALKQQLAQTVEQIPPNERVTWRVLCSVALIEGQIVRTQFKVAYFEQPL